jgi:CBS domain containing-hemolysin-like protein
MPPTPPPISEVTPILAQTGDVRLLLLYLAVAIVVSFLCSLAEAVLLSVPRAHVAILLREGKQTGIWLHQMKRNIDRPLAGILILNTVANTFGAAGVGAESFRIYGEKWVAVTSATVTLLVLIFSEIIPKTLGAVHAKTLAPLVTRLIRGMTLLTLPLVVVLNGLSRILGSSHAAVPTREEIAVVADLAEDAGVLREQETHVIRNLLQLNRIKVQDVMTPRSVAFLLKRETRVGDVIEKHYPIRFSRIPLYSDTADEIVAVVHRYEILQAWQDGQKDASIESLARPIQAIPEIASVAQALEQFISRHEHIFLAVDEFGGTAGIITLEDAVETLLGVEIVDETDSVKDMRQLARDAVTKRREEKESPD